MGSLEVDPLINANEFLIPIIILDSNTQQILMNTFDIQIDPLVNPTNIIVDDIRDTIHWN
jgi:hypothetical protein